MMKVRPHRLPILGSLLNLIAGMAGRAILEERVLREVLPGYDAYMAQVRYRFIPYIW